jgi:hypothetical protein
MDIKRLVIGMVLAMTFVFAWQWFVTWQYERHPEWRRPGPDRRDHRDCRNNTHGYAAHDFRARRISRGRACNLGIGPVVPRRQ